MTSPDYDLTIVGGGLVGASLALALRGSGLKLAMVEAVDRQAAGQPSYDDRTLVLNRVSCDWLHRAGLWPQLDDAATPIRRIHVSARGRFGQTHLDARRHGLDAFGHVVQARRLGLAMLPALAQQAQCRLYCPARLQAIQVGARHVRVTLSDGAGADGAGADGSGAFTTAFTTRLVVGADGAQSRVRQLAGLPAHEYDYRQTAVISNVSAEREHHHCAYERFTETGPLALLPHGPGRMGLVWTVASDQAQDILALDDSAFLAALQRHYGQRLGRFRRCGRRASYPLRLVHAHEPVAPRVVLIGNAAHTIHPISAQGFNLGLRDALELAHHLRALPATADCGAAAVLRGYQAARTPDQEATIRYTDGLVRLYRNPSPWFRLLGSAALLAHHALPPLQRRLVNQAMGYRGALAGAE